MRERARLQVARGWSDKPKAIKTVPVTPSEAPTDLEFNLPAGSAKQPVICFKTAKAACSAKWLVTAPKDGSGLPHGTKRMLLVLQVGTAGEGKDSIAADSSGQLRCTSVTPLELLPIPAEHAATAQPRQSFWVPGGAVHALG